MSRCERNKRENEKWEEKINIKGKEKIKRDRSEKNPLTSFVAGSADSGKEREMKLKGK